jgi:hypothetical protein
MTKIQSAIQLPNLAAGSATTPNAARIDASKVMPVEGVRTRRPTG